jgi:uncharacterized protein DUF2000
MEVRFDTKIAVPAAELRFAGLALHGPRNAVDKVLKGVTLHP